MMQIEHARNKATAPALFGLASSGAGGSSHNRKENKMHGHAEIVVKSPQGDIEKQIKRLLAKYEQGKHKNGFWNWYQIGGEWTGAHCKDYSPENDERNIETCRVCGGTGFRDDWLSVNMRGENSGYTCNGCGIYQEDGKWIWRFGAGKTLMHPTEWVRFKGDIMDIKDINDDLGCHTLVCGGDVYHDEEWDGTDWKATGFDGKVKARLLSLGISEGSIVTVDYHRSLL